MTDREQALSQIERLQTRHRLSRYPQTQAEAIARHYVSMAQNALFLMRAIDEVRYHELDQPQNMEAIEMVVNKIKSAHLKDLGIELEWREDHAS